MKKKIKCLFAIGTVLTTLSVCVGCNKDNPTPSPTPAPTATTIPVEATETPAPQEELPSLAQMAVESEIWGAEATKSLLGIARDSILSSWGEPDGVLSGMWGDIWDLDGERMIILYYNAEGIVSEIKINPWDSTGEETTPAPTELPIDDPTPTPTPTPEPTPTPMAVPTAAPGQPFAMVSPVPQSEVVDIVGTMTVDTYPVVDGSTATLPLSEAVFMAATGESAEVAAQHVVHTKTTNSYSRLYDGEVDLLIVYEPAESIVERMKTEPLCIKPIGLDALVFLANTANPVESLTMEQLIDIYSGKITNWSEVGGQDKNLLAFQRPDGSGSQTLMQKLVMGDVEMVTGDNVFRYSTMADILEGMLSYNNEDNTLGYSVFYYANNMYFEKDLKLMGVDGVLPSTQTIYDGSYQLTNAFYAVIRTDEPADSNAKKIFDWLTGEAGQQLVLDLGYVPVQMPEGADISDVKVEKQEKVEILAKEPLEEGQYFVFFNPQNMVSDYYYGDLTVYNHNWQEIANFYNVALNHGVQGVYTNRYLPIGQIRLNEDGEQKAKFGIFDLEQGEYSIAPTYTGMEMLDVERGYYAVAPQTVSEDEYSWMNWNIINGTGEVLLEKVEMSDWLMISQFGNGYLEHYINYSDWDMGYIYRFYDENLKLKKVYCQQAAGIPDDADKIEGVEYILLDNSGCLVNADGEVVLNWATFLDKFGDGEDMKVKTKFYSVTLAEENVCYPVLYQKKIYLVDCNLNLIRVVENSEIVASFENADFFENFCYYHNTKQNKWVYRTYEGEMLRTSDGMVPVVEKTWTSDSYLLYRRFENQLFLEEYKDNGDLLKYSIALKEGFKDYVLDYTGNDYVVLNENVGEQMQDPYYNEVRMIPQYTVSLYYQGNLVGVKAGMDGANLYALDEEHQIWNVRNGNRLTTPSESIYEDFEYAYALGDYAIIEGEKIVYELDNAYLMFQGNDAAFFLNGNYMYAVGFDGEVYIRALHTFLNND